MSAPLNRYEQERIKLPRRIRRPLMLAFRKQWKRPPVSSEHALVRDRVVYVSSPSGGVLVCLCTVDRFPGFPLQQHISVSRRDHLMPTWDELVLVRSLAWEDDAEVVQVLPPLAGPKAEPWVNVHGVEVLHLRRYLGGAR